MEPPQYLLLGFAALILVLFVVKRLRQVPAAKARELLANNALLIDVRSSEEFATSHVKGALNLPLEQIQRRIDSIEPDHSRPILVHCLSGTRSAMACRILRGFGYSEVHNLGSLGRARSLAG